MSSTVSPNTDDLDAIQEATLKLDRNRGTARLKPLTSEQARILFAALRGQLYENQHGRYVIAGDVRPDRRERERLFKRGLLVRATEHDEPVIRPTDRGIALLLDYHSVRDVAARELISE